MTSEEAPRPGRPRDDTIDTAILEAVLSMVEEDGLGALTVDGIAERAGVSKATIYRRWDSKEEIVVDAVASCVSAVDLPDAPTVRDGLVAGMLHITSSMSTTAGQIFPWVVGEIAARTEIGDRYVEVVVRPKRRALAALISAGVERGELRSDLDVELAVDMVMGSILVRKLSGPGPLHDVDRIERHVDYLIDGWRSRD